MEGKLLFNLSAVMQGLTKFLELKRTRLSTSEIVVITFYLEHGLKSTWFDTSGEITFSSTGTVFTQLSEKYFVVTPVELQSELDSLIETELSV